MKFNKDYMFGLKEINAMGLSQMKPKGITIHNTANKRHASAREEAANQFNNNTKHGKDNPSAACNFFVDEKDIYLVVPMNVHGWHAGDGSNGFGNKQTISIEICRSLDYTTDRYAKAEEKTIKLVAWLIKEHNIPITMVKRHYDYSGKKCPHRMFESNPNSWNSFIDKVKQEGRPGIKPSIPSTPDATLSNTQIAKEVILGKWGNGAERTAKLNASGYDPASVQREVNRLLSVDKVAEQKPKPVIKSLNEIAKEVLRGDWGNGQARKDKLKSKGYDPTAVQNEVNKIAGGTSKPKPKKSNETIAKEIINGNYGWGSGQARKDKLKAAGYNPSTIQALVNKMI